MIIFVSNPITTQNIVNRVLMGRENPVIGGKSLLPIRSGCQAYDPQAKNRPAGGVNTARLMNLDSETLHVDEKMSLTSLILEILK